MSGTTTGFTEGGDSVRVVLADIDHFASQPNERHPPSARLHRQIRSPSDVLECLRLSTTTHHKPMHVIFSTIIFHELNKFL